MVVVDGRDGPLWNPQTASQRSQMAIMKPIKEKEKVIKSPNQAESKRIGRT